MARSVILHFTFDTGKNDTFSLVIPSENLVNLGERINIEGEFVQIKVMDTKIVRDGSDTDSLSSHGTGFMRSPDIFDGQIVNFDFCSWKYGGGIYTLELRISHRGGSTLDLRGS